MRLFTVFIFVGLSSTSFAMDLKEKVLHTYGDSITAGYAVSPDESYAFNLAQDAGAVLKNHGTKDQSVCEMSQQIFSQDVPTRTSGTDYATVMIGTEDAMASEPPSAWVFQKCLRASLTWLATSSSTKALANSSACQKSGSWSVDVAAPLQGLVSNHPGDTMDCTVHGSDTKIFIWYRASARPA